MLVENVSPAVNQPGSRAVGQPPCNPFGAAWYTDCRKKDTPGNRPAGLPHGWPTPCLGKKWPSLLPSISQHPLWGRELVWSRVPPFGLILVLVDASCWAARGNVLRLPGDAAVVMRSLPASACTPVPASTTPPAGSPSAPPQNLTS
eukprot:1154313-Pelagomonas_calceolata.AAC.2